MSKRLENVVRLEAVARWVFRVIIVVTILLLVKGAFIAAGVGGVMAYAINKLNKVYENKIPHYLAIGEGRPVVMNPRTIMPQER